MKYWIGTADETRIIAINSEKIACGSPRTDKFQAFSFDLVNGKMPEGLFSIPFSYIRKIEMKDIDNKINIFFGEDAYELLTIKNESRRQEVFEVLKDLSPKLEYSTRKVGRLGAAKKPLIALAVLTPLFGLIYMMAIALENNELSGSQVALLLAVASLGSQNVIKLFIGILVIILIAIIRQMSNA
ncbi:MAG: hypothetical protein KDC44_10180, partial [Phaeodactylibacter sp.]|nr:hypothetical protein [Phaeodactylibacter sp.]